MNKNTEHDKNIVNLSIKLNTELRDKFVDLANSKGLTQFQLIEVLLRGHNLWGGIVFDEEETELIQRGVKVAPESFQKKLRRGILRYAKDMIKSETLDKSDIDVNVKTSQRAGNLRADQLIEKMFEHNNEAANPFDKIFITKSSAYRFSLKQKALDSDRLAPSNIVINKCLERNKEVIMLHHKEHHLDKDHNFKSVYQRSKK